MSVEFFTKSQSSPYEKFLANTGFMRPNIPPEVEHLIYRMTTFENCAYEPLKDKNITLTDGAITKPLSLLYGIGVDREILETDKDGLFVWCNECHLWHLHYFDMHTPAIKNPVYGNPLCNTQFNELYQSMIALKGEDELEKNNISSNYKDGYYILPVAIATLIHDSNGTPIEINWDTFVKHSSGPIEYNYEKAGSSSAMVINQSTPSQDSDGSDSTVDDTEDRN